MPSMKLLITALFISILHSFSAQSDWRFKPYVVVNDTFYENLKHPVFIMDSVLYIRTAEGVVLTFPSRDVNYISKRCFYDRVTPKEKNRLSRSIATSSYLSGIAFVGGILLLRENIISYQFYAKHSILYYYSPLGAIFGVGFVVPSVIAMYHLIQRKRQTKMILESKGLRFISSEEP